MKWYTVGYYFAGNKPKSEDSGIGHMVAMVLLAVSVSCSFLSSTCHLPPPPMCSIKYVTFTFTSRQRLSESAKCRLRYLCCGASSPSAYCRRFSVPLSSLSLIMFCYVMSPVSSLIGRKCFLTQRQTGRWNSALTSIL